mgnify:CR=1 FL=1
MKLMVLLQNNKNKIILILIISIGYYFLNLFYNFSIPCIFNKITGFYCPGCGITRMLFSIMQLRFYQAFRFNPLVFILLILSIIYCFFKLILKKDIYISNKTYIILLIITILFGILRNISFFKFLQPTLL